MGETSTARLLKRYRYSLAASGLIVGGVALRLALILIGWPHGNSEEGTMGLEALHILQRGEHPIYLYGQNYMGVSEAYLAALAFRLFGVSTVALRLGMIAFYALFMVGVFWLAHLLYSRRVALVSLAALTLGTPFIVQIELLADGGKAETIAFGALMFALAAWLALSRDAAPQTRWRRSAAFFAWGLCAGLGLYTYAIIAPFALTSGLLLWLTCRREPRGWASALAGLLLGLLPAILYTATMPLADNPIAVFLSLHQSLNAQNAPGWYLLLKQVDGVLFYTLPTVTGLLEFYPVQALPLYGPPSLATAIAVLVGGGWSLAYLALLGMATARPLRALRERGTLRDWLAELPNATKGAPAPAAPRDLARLLLALTAWLTITAYTFSATAANNPHSGRYMIGLLVITPAILWPLLDGAPSPAGKRRSPLPCAGEGLGVGARPLAAVLLVVALIVGALSTAQSIPHATHLDRKDARFASDLLSRGVTRFYSDYWTCDLLNFNTRERLTCAVVNDYAQPGLTRYHPYAVAVRADPNAPYVLPQNSSTARTFALYAAQHGLRYATEPLDGYLIFTPLPS